MSGPFDDELEAFKRAAIDAGEDYLAALCASAQGLIKKVDEITTLIGKEAALLGTRGDIVGDLTEIGLIAENHGYDDIARTCAIALAPSAGNGPQSMTSLQESLDEALAMLGKRQAGEDDDRRVGLHLFQSIDDGAMSL